MHIKKLAAIAASAILAFTAFAPTASAQTAAGSVDMGSVESVVGLLGQIPNVPAPTDTPVSAGSTTLKRAPVNVSGQGSREYLIETPSTMDPNISYPVIFGFGGWQHNASTYRGYAHLNQVAGQEAIIVYPEGRVQAWEGPKYAETSRGQDVAFVKSILGQVKGSYKVDTSRVFATGLSNGGGMVVTLACQAPEVFSAVASVSGAYYNPTVDNCANGTVDTLLIHGTADDHMLYNGGRNDHGGAYYSVPQTAQRIGARNGCTSTALTGAVVSGRTETYTLAGCKAGGATQVMKVNGGGHTWYESDPSAERAVWIFLKSH